MEPTWEWCTIFDIQRANSCFDGHVFV